MLIGKHQSNMKNNFIRKWCIIRGCNFLNSAAHAGYAQNRDQTGSWLVAVVKLEFYILFVLRKGGATYIN